MFVSRAGTLGTTLGQCSSWGRQAQGRSERWQLRLRLPERPRMLPTASQSSGTSRRPMRRTGQSSSENLPSTLTPALNILRTPMCHRLIHPAPAPISLRDGEPSVVPCPPGGRHPWCRRPRWSRPTRMSWRPPPPAPRVSAPTPPPSRWPRCAPGSRRR